MSFIFHGIQTVKIKQYALGTAALRRYLWQSREGTEKEAETAEAAMIAGFSAVRRWTMM